MRPANNVFSRPPFLCKQPEGIVQDAHSLQIETQHMGLFISQEWLLFPINDLVSIGSALYRICLWRQPVESSHWLFWEKMCCFLFSEL